MPQRDYNSSPIPNMFPQIMANDLTSQIANVNISEVKNSLFNICGLKTPSVDGFQRVSIKTNGIYAVMRFMKWLLKRLGKAES